jgi:hypothetical protein
MDVLCQACNCPLHDVDPYRRLDWLLRNTARCQKSWSDHFIGNVRVQLEVTKEIIHCLEMSRDRRILADHEESLRQLLKMKSLGLSSLRRTIMPQESCLLWLSEGNAPMRFFHAHVNNRRHENHIHSLVDGDRVLVVESNKAEVV